MCLDTTPDLYNPLPLHTIPLTTLPLCWRMIKCTQEFSPLVMIFHPSWHTFLAQSSLVTLSFFLSFFPSSFFFFLGGKKNERNQFQSQEVRNWRTKGTNSAGEWYNLYSPLSLTPPPHPPHSLSTHGFLLPFQRRQITMAVIWPIRPTLFHLGVFLAHGPVLSCGGVGVWFSHQPFSPRSTVQCSSIRTFYFF